MVLRFSVTKIMALLLREYAAHGKPIAEMVLDISG
jgi:hypothetical protein